MRQHWVSVKKTDRKTKPRQCEHRIKSYRYISVYTYTYTYIKALLKRWQNVVPICTYFELATNFCSHCFIWILDRRSCHDCITGHHSIKQTLVDIRVLLLQNNKQQLTLIIQLCFPPATVFSRSYCTQYDRPLASSCRPSVCLSVCDAVRCG